MGLAEDACEAVEEGARQVFTVLTRGRSGAAGRLLRRASRAESGILERRGVQKPSFLLMQWKKSSEVSSILLGERLPPQSAQRKELFPFINVYSVEAGRSHFTNLRLLAGGSGSPVPGSRKLGGGEARPSLERGRLRSWYGWWPS